MSKLNLKVLVPMYFEDNFEDICERANSLGMESLTEDEQYFMDNYRRLFDFMDKLSPAEVEELENAIDNDEVYNKYSNAEMIEANKKKCKNRKNKTLTDILLICKGWYNKKLYYNILEALNAYYHKYYGCEDITMDKAFAVFLFLKPLALKAIELKPRLANYIFEPQYSLISNEEKFSEVMYDRLLGLIQMIEIEMFDLSEYADMFAKAEDCNYEDESIGII